jgi:UDP-glucose 4-epimerase
MLVLGGCGFIGSHVVDCALAVGHQVRVLTRRPDPVRAPLPGVDYRLAAFDDLTALTDALQGCDAVLHLISTSYPASAERDPIGDVTGNLTGTLRLLDAMRATEVRRLVFISSGGVVYGAPDCLPVPETHPLRPIGSYGIVKVAIESYIAIAKRQGLVATVLRPANVFGPRQTHSVNRGFITTALQCLARDEPLDLYGDGSVVRDFLAVADLADLCLRGLQDGAGLTLNAGSGIGRSLMDVLETIKRVTGKQVRLNRLPARAIDAPVSVLDISLARNRLDWEPRIAFEDALAETWDWVCTQGQNSDMISSSDFLRLATAGTVAPSAG